MGAKCSTISSLEKNIYLERFTGLQNISQDDVFWTEFLQSGFPAPVTMESFQRLYVASKQHLSNLSKNDQKSQNFTVLLKNFITEGSNFAANFVSHQNHYKPIVNQLTNAMLIIRCFTKFLIENYSERDMIRFFMPSTSDGIFIPLNMLNIPVSTSAPLADYIMQLLFVIIIDIPVNDLTYGLINEAISTTIVLLSPQLYISLTGDLTVFHQYAMWGKSSTKASTLVYALINIFITNMPCPWSYIQGQSSFLWSAASTLASGLLTVVTLGYAGSGRSEASPSTKALELNQNGDSSQLSSAITPLPVDKQLCAHSCHLLARQANILLLLLTAHATVNLPQKSVSAINGGTTSPSANNKPMIIRNPYREALFKLTNVSDAVAIGDKTSRVDFKAFLEVISKSLELDASTLLLYLLLHRNSNFRVFMLQEKNCEKLLVPLLGILYRLSGDNSHLVYMILIVILILTEHGQFIEQVHNVQLKTLPWKLDKLMNDISLGSLLVYVLVRTVQNHLNQLKERYLHINSLAALANMSTKVTRLNQQASYAIVNLLVMLLKRHTRIENRIKDFKGGIEIKQNSNSNSVNGSSNSVTPTSPNSISKVNVVSASIDHLNMEDLKNDLVLLEEVIRTMLEIINSIITHSVVTNQHLIYALLHQKDRFMPLRKSPLFQDVMHNLDVIMIYFTQKLDKEFKTNGSQVIMPEQVMELIKQHISSLPRHQHLKKFPELRFKYVEESSPDDFFVPYVWLLVFHSGSDYFDSSIVRVFRTTTHQPLEQNV